MIVVTIERLDSDEKATRIEKESNEFVGRLKMAKNSHLNEVLKDVAMSFTRIKSTNFPTETA